MPTDRPRFRRRCARLLTASVCASAAWPAYAGAPADLAGPLPVRSMFAANSVPPITPPIGGEAGQILPTAAPGAKEDPGTDLLTKATPSQNVTINLINRLVARGVLPKEDAEALIQQAEADAIEARALAAATQAAVADAQAVVSQAAPLFAIPPQHPATPDIPPYSGSDGAVRVTYIPEHVKAQMRDEIQATVLAQARNERWADPARAAGMDRAYQALRRRAHARRGPLLSQRQRQHRRVSEFQRDQHRRAVRRQRHRLFAAAQCGSGPPRACGCARGSARRPISGKASPPGCGSPPAKTIHRLRTNQSLGAPAQGQGGNFSKYAIWLDRGFLKYETGTETSKRAPAPMTNRQEIARGKEISAPAAEPLNRKVVISLGRFDNPFFATDIIWDDDVGFDGIAGQRAIRSVREASRRSSRAARSRSSIPTSISRRISPDEIQEPRTSGSTPPSSASTGSSHKDFTVKLGGAYYDFDSVEGELSEPFTPLTAQDAGNTDNTRPSFAQKGNTYMAAAQHRPHGGQQFRHDQPVPILRPRHAVPRARPHRTARLQRATSRSPSRSSAST